MTNHISLTNLRYVLLNLIIFTVILGCNMSQADRNEKIDLNNPNYQSATFGGGCFWCMEPPYDDLTGIITTTVGYAGGKTEDPTYEEVSTGKTGHAEVVQIVFDTTKITYWALLQTFWRNIDPTNPLGQFADRGSQYRTAIFYHDDKQKELAIKSKEELEKSGKFDKPIVTEIVHFSKFYPAEDYHQEYYKKHPLRYNSYKVGSGRAGYLKNMWGDKK